jgi:hypothetical protein
MKINMLLKTDEFIEAGFPEHQAKMLARNLALAGETDLRLIATKEHIQNLEFAITSGFKRLKNVVYLFGTVLTALLFFFVLKVVVY